MALVCVACALIVIASLSQLIREGLETRVRELKARLDRFEERRREQNQRHYVVPISIVSPEELERL